VSSNAARVLRAAWRWYTGKFGASLTCFLLVLVAAVWWLLSPGDNEAAGITEKLRIDIPSNASNVRVDDPAIALQGTCSGVEFLMPTIGWREYVGRYFDIAALEPTYSAATSCGSTLIECERTYNTQPGSNSGYQTSDRVDDKYRGVVALPDCINGMTKIAWSIAE
jgi:hypothetical protein